MSKYKYCEEVKKSSVNGQNHLVVNKLLAEKFGILYKIKRTPNGQNTHRQPIKRR